MKTLILSLILCGWISPALAIDQVKLDVRIRLLTTKFEGIQQEPDRRVPPEVLRRARGLVLLESTKAGSYFAFNGENGVALLKDRRGNRGPAAFWGANEARVEPQFSGEHNFCVILLMDANTTRALTELTMEFGGETRGTAGTDPAGANGQVTQPKLYDMRVYSGRNGFYAGVPVKNGWIAPDNGANVSYYGRPLTMNDILFGRKVKKTPAATDLAATISDCSKR